MQVYEDGMGGSITLVQLGDHERPTVFRMIMPKGFGPPAAEYHPQQREDFRVLRGTLDLGPIDGQRVVLNAGDTYSLPAGVLHLPRNGGDDELEFEATLTPGLATAEMFAQVYTETRARRGLGRFVRVAMAFRRHGETIDFPQPVRTILDAVATLGRALGVQPTPRPDEPVPHPPMKVPPSREA